MTLSPQYEICGLVDGWSGRIGRLARRAADSHGHVEHCGGRNVSEIEDPMYDPPRDALLAEIHRFGFSSSHSDTVDQDGEGHG